MLLRMREIDASVAGSGVLEAPATTCGSRPAAPTWPAGPDSAVCVGARRLPRAGGAGAGDRTPTARCCTTRCRTRRCPTGSAWPGGARQRDLGLPDLQQELRSLLLRQRPLGARNQPCSSPSPSPRPGRQFIPDPRAGQPGRLSRQAGDRPAACATGCAPACRVCPTRDRAGAVRIDLGRCVLCGDCEPACPSARISSATT
jgi:hypothetical protein